MYGTSQSIETAYTAKRALESSVDDTFTSVAGKAYEMVKGTEIKSFYTEVPAEKAHPAEVDGNYGWSLFKNIDTSNPATVDANLTAQYTGVAYIRTASDEIIFLNEITKSAAQLAQDIIDAENGYNGASLDGSFGYLADKLGA